MRHTLDCFFPPRQHNDPTTVTDIFFVGFFRVFLNQPIDIDIRMRIYVFTLYFSV